MQPRCGCGRFAAKGEKTCQACSSRQRRERFMARLRKDWEEGVEVEKPRKRSRSEEAELERLRNKYLQQ